MGLERLKYAHQYQLSMLQHAEAKNGVITTVAVALLATQSSPQGRLDYLVLGALFFSAASGAISFFPSLTKSERHARSLLFFNDVIKFANSELHADEFFSSETDDYLSQIKELAHIISRKLGCFSVAVISFIASLAFMAIQFIAGGLNGHI